MPPCLEQHTTACTFTRNFSLFLPGIMGKKFAAQTESCPVDEKVHMNTAMFNLFRDSLRTARISEIQRSEWCADPFGR